MKRWGALITVFYSLMVLCLLWPLLFVLCDWHWGSGLFSRLSPLAELLSNLYGNWFVWIWAGILVSGQVFLLLVAVDTSRRRLRPRWRVAATATLAGLFLAILTGAAISAVVTAIFMDNPPWPLGEFVVILPCLLGTWIIWGVVFHIVARNRPHPVARGIDWLYRGSVLELLIAVTSHIIVRHRDECSAPAVTSFGIVTGLAIMAFCFGPAILPLYHKRMQDRVRPGAERNGSPSSSGTAHSDDEALIWDVRRARHRLLMATVLLGLSSVAVIAGAYFKVRAHRLARQAAAARSVALSQRLVSNAEAELQEAPVRATLLAVQAASCARAAQPHDPQADEALADAERTLRACLQTVGGWSLLAPDPGLKMAWSEDRCWLATLSSDGWLRVWDLTSEDPRGPISTTLYGNQAVQNLHVNRREGWLVGVRRKSRAQPASVREAGVKGETSHDVTVVFFLYVPDKKYWEQDLPTPADGACRVRLARDGKAAMAAVEESKGILLSYWSLSGGRLYFPSRAVLTRGSSVRCLSDDLQWLVTQDSEDRESHLLWRLYAWPVTAGREPLKQFRAADWDIDTDSVLLHDRGMLVVRSGVDERAAEAEGKKRGSAGADRTEQGEDDDQGVGGLALIVEAIKAARQSVNQTLQRGELEHWEFPFLEPSKLLTLERTDQFELDRDGRWLVVSGTTCRLVDLYTKAVDNLNLAGAGAEATFSADGRWLAAWTKESTVLRDLQAADPATATRKLPSGLCCGRFSTDSGYLVAVKNDDAVVAWDLHHDNPGLGYRTCGHVDTGRPTARYIPNAAHDRGPNRSAESGADDLWSLSPFDNEVDGAGLAVGTRHAAYRQQLFQLDANTNSTGQAGGGSTRALSGHESPISLTVFSPDDRWLVTVAQDNSIRLWDLSTDCEAFRSFGSDPERRLRQLDTNELTQLAAEVAGRGLTEEERSSHGLTH